MTPYRLGPPVPPVHPDEAIARAALEAELRDDENLLWAGRPRAGLALEMKDGPRSVVALLFTCVIVVATIQDLWVGRGPVALLVGLPCAAIALSVIFVPLVRDNRQRARTFYGISNERLLIVTSSGSSKSYWLAHLPQISLVERSEGFGDIFVNSPTYVGRKRQYNTAVMARVRNAKETHRLLLEAMAAARIA